MRRPGGVKQPTKSAATLEAEAAAEIDMLAGEAGAAARQEGAGVAKVFVDSFRKRFHRDPNYAASG